MQKKYILVLPFIILTLLIWAIVVSGTSGVDYSQIQRSKIDKADEFIADEIYIRSIPLYEEAFGIDGDFTMEAGIKLTEAYREFGDEDSYYEMTEKLCKNSVGDEKYYKITAEYYLSGGDYTTGMNYFLMGIEKTGSEALVEEMESHRYDYNLVSREYDDVILTAANYIPVYRAEKWGFINRSGSETVAIQYQEAMPFSEELFPVKRNDIFEMVDFNGRRYALNKSDVQELCWYNEARGMGAVRLSDGKCAVFNNDFVLAEGRYDDIKPYSGSGAAYLNGEKWGLLTYVVNEETGVGALTEYCDCRYKDIALNAYGQCFNGERYFADDGSGYKLYGPDNLPISDESYEDASPFYSSGELAAVKKNGKWGFIDRNGSVVIDYQFDEADSFNFGLAAVKTASEWYYINTKGEAAVRGYFTAAGPVGDSRSAMVMVNDKWRMIRLKWSNYEQI